MAGFRTVLAALLIGLVGLAPSAQARVDLTPEEREIVTWVRDSDPGRKIHDSIVRLVQAEEYTGRAFVMLRCARVDGRGIERWLRPHYVAIVRDSARHMAEVFEADIRANGHLRDGMQAGLLYLWRSWDQAKRESWLAYMRSPAAKLGKNLAQVLEGFEDLPSLSEDVNTGKLNLAWLGWSRELLDAARLTDSFRAAANGVEPRLGDRFVEETSRPIGELPGTERQLSMTTLSKGLTDRWEDIGVALFQSMPAATRAAVEAWSDHPVQTELVDLAELMQNAHRDLPTPGGPFSQGGPPRRPAPAALVKFLAEVGTDSDNHTRRIALFTDSLRPRLQPHCATLK